MADTRKKYSEDGARTFPGNGRSRDEELAALRKEKKKLREERDILRKAISHLLQTPEMKYEFMTEQRRTHSVKKMSKALGAARSGYYSWIDGRESAGKREGTRGKPPSIRRRRTGN